MDEEMFDIQKLSLHRETSLSMKDQGEDR